MSVSWTCPLTWPNWFSSQENLIMLKMFSGSQSFPARAVHLGFAEFPGPLTVLARRSVGKPGREYSGPLPSLWSVFQRKVSFISYWKMIELLKKAGKTHISKTKCELFGTANKTDHDVVLSCPAPPILRASKVPELFPWSPSLPEHHLQRNLLTPPQGTLFLALLLLCNSCVSWNYYFLHLSPYCTI